MATIELYKNKINMMSDYMQEARLAVSDFCTDLAGLREKILAIDTNVCDNAISSISSSTKTQEEQIADLDATKQGGESFITLAVNRDNAAAEAVCKAKDDFYKKYDYLKPESEKGDWEKFCDTLGVAWDWCKEHWKLIVTVVICIAAVVIICTGIGGVLLAGAALGALIGAASGGLIGGVTSILQGGSFLEGFEERAFSGAITGAIFGGVGGAGLLCLEKH